MATLPITFCNNSESAPSGDSGFHLPAYLPIYTLPIMSSGWITKENASSASGSTQQGTSDLASRLGGFGLQDKTNGASQPASGTAQPAESSSSTSEKPQTVPDGWAAPAPTSSTSTPAAAATDKTASAAPAVATPAEPTQQTGTASAEQDAIAAAEKEAQEMSHEDGENGIP